MMQALPMSKEPILAIMSLIGNYPAQREKFGHSNYPAWRENVVMTHVLKDVSRTGKRSWVVLILSQY
jgi:hypothetical protein